MKYRLAIFDMDGTILDTLEDLADATNYTLKACGYPARTLEEIRWFVGNGIRKLIERALPEGAPDAEIDRLFGVFIPYYQEHCAVKTGPYAGINELIKTLRSRGIATAVVSNKAEAAVGELCETYFDGLFDAYAGDRPDMRRKPAPDSVNLILHKLGFDRADAVYIGDSDVDLATAKNASLPCIGCAWGFRGREFLENNGATMIADTPSDILRFF
ncbi:MAG: HAD family hydrolase [Lachnospiraceae bacterium]|nr:HAD family hydrolase [Lachnospiraceae bacterium]